MKLATLLTLSLSALGVFADVTVQHLAQATMVASGAHNTTRLTPPGLPNPMPATNYFIQLQTGGTPGASMQLPSAWIGFSIEMSVANQVLGHNSTLIQVPFLNLMQHIVQRSGGVNVRVGGNTQDYASLIPDLGDGRILEKDTAFITANPTQTPPLLLSWDMLYLMANISTFTNVRWYLGIPFNDTNFRLDIVDQGERILGDHLLGFQAGNEPDFYGAHGHRDKSYSPQGYIDDLKALVQKMSDPRYDTAKRSLIAPSIANANGWTPKQLWDLGLVDQLNENLKFLAVERYPTDNCGAIFPDPNNPPKDIQATFPTFLSHQSPKDLVGGYFEDSAFAQSKQKPFLMFETNTASCGGFPGISDSFGAVLWALDYALQMGHTNFSGAMFHVGGQRTFYNPFTAAPTNETTFHQWTVGSVYYSALVMAEVMGASNTTQILDLNANSGNVFTPAYAVYENGGQPSKLALFNYMDDATGGAAITVTFAIGGSGVNQANGTPGSVKVKYLASSSVADNRGNFTWAGQTFGPPQTSDGRLIGTEDVQTVNCNPDNTCAVRVPSPGFALVFFNEPNPQAASPSKTFSTTAITQTRNTAQVAPEVLATSNGHQDVAAKKFSTSFGSGNKNSAVSGSEISSMALVGSLLVGVVVLLDLRRQ
ncbi:glycoside hydrolase family 79 protein [Flagelloscypha sp. PMI_526]|nr:glycoside hydrolase family 79 protein [Flagelloscypha sp. PMI_526]